MEEEKDLQANEPETTEAEPEALSGDAVTEITNTDDSVAKQTDYGLIQPRSITNEMSESYLDYAMSVIVARALPDVRDGLKPVHRRILFAMHDMGLSPTSKHRKSAKINGEVLGNYHPHGELAVYDSMVRMAQWWSLRLPLVDGQGNFGSMDGDSPAASRYTEARLATPALAILADIEKETVDFRDNYDGTRQEPTVLPTRLPNLLINGSQGIAVGMATNIPPHNPTEVIDGLLHLQSKPDAEVDEIMEIVKGPDFPTGGIAYCHEDIKEAFTTGRGRVVVRGRAEITDEAKREAIIVSELPYQTNKATFITHIADLVKNKKIEGIHDIRDESDRKDGVRVVIELKSGAASSKILNQLYEMTELQSVVHYNMVALVDGIQPKTLSLIEILTEFLAHRTDVVTRRTQYELRIAKARAHILEGLKIALDHLDEIIALIRKSESRDTAKAALIETYKLSDLQANAILDMRLSQLANLERQKIYEEYDAVMRLIADLEDILNNPQRVEEIIRNELNEIKEKYGSDRKTEIRPEALGQLSALDLIPNEDVLISITKNNYVKRLPPDAYRAQSRGGKGVIGMSTREDDSVMEMIFASTHDDILFFTDKGRAFMVKAFEIPASNRQSKGIAIPNILRVTPEEKVTGIVSLNKDEPFAYLFFATKQGLVKRIKSEDLNSIRKSGVNVIGLKVDDQLIWVKKTTGKDDVAQITRNGQVIVYNEDEVRAMGRGASGVRGMKLKSGDVIIETAVLAETTSAVCVISERGIGKKVSVKEFRNQHRGGSGIRIAKLTEKTGLLVAGAVIEAGAEDLIIATTSGQIIRIPQSSVKMLSRQASGVILIRTNSGDTVSSLAVVGKEEDVSE